MVPSKNAGKWHNNPAPKEEQRRAHADLKLSLRKSSANLEGKASVSRERGLCDLYWATATGMD